MYAIPTATPWNCATTAAEPLPRLTTAAVKRRRQPSERVVKLGLWSGSVEPAALRTTLTSAIPAAASRRSRSSTRRRNTTSSASRVSAPAARRWRRGDCRARSTTASRGTIRWRPWRPSTSLDLGHNHIGTEHLLLGLLDEEDGLAARVLGQLGVSLEAARAQVVDILGPGGTAPSGHIPFTPRAKKVMELSLREALALGHNYIGTEHILLGLIREGEGVAAQVLVRLGAELSQTRQEIIALLAGYSPSRVRGLRPAPGTSLTPAASKVLETARAMAGAQAMGSQQVLLGLLADEGSLAARAFAALGITRPQLEARLADLDPSGTTDELPEQAGARRTRLQVAGDRVTVQIEEADLAGRLRAMLGRRRPSNDGWVLSGTDPEAKGFAKLWKVLRPALDDICTQLEQEPLSPVTRSVARSSSLGVVPGPLASGDRGLRRVEPARGAGRRFVLGRRRRPGPATELAGPVPHRQRRRRLREACPWRRRLCASHGAGRSSGRGGRRGPGLGSYRLFPRPGPGAGPLATSARDRSDRLCNRRSGGRVPDGRADQLTGWMPRLASSVRTRFSISSRTGRTSATDFPNGSVSAQSS